MKSNFIVRIGGTNEELQLANEHLIIPADTDYPVLNLAELCNWFVAKLYGIEV